jgi:ABC-2 type transport system ATP-binding protein
MEFRVLGPVQVMTEGRLVPLKERKLRLVLALLLLDINQLVPMDRLVDVLWMRDPPSSARRIVQAHLSRLRTTLEALDGGQARLARHGACYVLACDPEHVDVHLFRALLNQARRTDDDHAKVVMLHRALSLWRGPALADVATDRLRRELCSGLDEARLATVEDRVDVELRLGHHTAVLDELTGLHARYPSRVRTAGQLMVALHRSGRSSEGLQVYLRTRKWLRSELGVDPTADLDRLYTAILRADPALDAPGPSPHGPKPPVSPTGSVPAVPQDQFDVPGYGVVSGPLVPDGSSRAGEASRPRHLVGTAADMGVEIDVRRELELIATQRGVDSRVLAGQIIGEWVATQQRQVSPPNPLDELLRHLDEARQAAATMARQAEPGPDGVVAA